MRVCARQSSPYYNPFNMGSQVWCDGKLISRVIEACEEDGWVIRHQTDAEGKALIDRVQGCAIHEILRGRVSIVNPRLLPMVVPRKLRVLVMEGATLSKHSRMLMEYFEAHGDLVEVVEVKPADYRGIDPAAVWIDDLGETMEFTVRRAAEKIVREFVVDSIQPYLKRAHRLQDNERPWLSRRKGR